ncbi:hypothetical protein [Shimazuella alba]
MPQKVEYSLTEKEKTLISLFDVMNEDRKI